jgi:hypothetical protein
MIKTRRRFPNFVCDGFPLGPPGDPVYYDTFETTDDFYNLEWVKEKHEGFDIRGWFINKDGYMGTCLYAVYAEEDGTGTYFCHAILEEGEMDLPEYRLSEHIYQKIMDDYGLKTNPKYL